MCSSREWEESKEIERVKERKEEREGGMEEGFWRKSRVEGEESSSVNSPSMQ